MWVGTDFPEDNEDLSWIQHDVYFFLDRLQQINAGEHEFCIKHGDILHGSCSYIFAIAKESMIRKHSSLPVYKNKNLNDIKSFDHRVLQSSHGKIASFYRWIEAGKNRKPALSGNQTEYEEWSSNNRHIEIENGRLIPLNAYHKYLLESWKTYLVREIHDIVYGNPSVAEQIVTAVWRQNTEQGYRAESEIDAFLTLRYGIEFQQACDDWRKSLE